MGGCAPRAQLLSHTSAYSASSLNELKLGVASKKYWWRKARGALVFHRLLVDCNQVAVDIDTELSVVHNWVRSRAPKRSVCVLQSVRAPLPLEGHEA